MMLVDSSVWIAYFNGTVTAQTEYLDKVLGNEEIIVGDLILAEVLQGFRHDKDYTTAKNALSAFSSLGLVGYAHALKSADNYRYLRKQGITIRKTIDCLIATFCIENDVELLHSDIDFDPFERYLNLKVVHP